MQKINIRLILIIIGFLTSGQTHLKAQENLKIPIDIKSSQVKIKDLLEELEKQTGYVFSYASTVLDNQMEININYNCKTLSDVLEIISYEAKVDYHLKANKLLFYKKQESHKKAKPILKIGGKIKDTETNKDIPFAAIQLKNTNKGTSSNADGLFEFKIPESHINDTLIYSCLGYQNKKIAVKELQDNVIYLIPSSIEISEIVVKPIPAEEILRDALEMIPKNYPNKPVVLDAFYRTLLTQNGKYVRLAEAACSFNTASYTDTVDHYSRQKSYYSFKEVMNKDSFIVKRNLGSNNFVAWYDCHVSEKDKVCIVDSRVSKDYSKTLSKNYISGGPLQSIASDKVRFRTDFLDVEKIKYYKYRYKGVTSYNNREVYIIEFHPRKIQFRLKRKEDHRQWVYKHNFKNAELEGKIFIDSKTMAIIGLDYEYKQPNRNVGYLMYHVKVDYQNYGEKWYLRQISKSFGHMLAIDNKRKAWGHFKASTNLIVNSIDTLANFKYDSIPPMPYSRFISMYLDAGDYHPEFWGNYNTILTSNLEKKIISDLEKTKSLEEQFSLSQLYDSSLTAPVAYEDPFVDTIHGDIRIDPYWWMENKDGDSIINYLIDENNYTDNYVVQFKKLKGKLVDEASMWFTPGKMLNQHKNGEYIYFERYSDDSNFSVLYRKKDTIGSKEELILDFNELAEKSSNFFLSDYVISPDNKRLALTIDTTGAEKYIVLFKDLESKKFLKDTLNNVLQILWNNYQDNIYYVSVDSLNRIDGLYKHNPGDCQDLDLLIFKEKDDRYDVHIKKDKSERYLIINSVSYVNNELQYLDMLTGEMKMLYPRSDKQFCKIRIKDNQIFVQVENDSLNFISAGTLNNPDNLSDTLYATSNCDIINYKLVGDNVVIQEIENANQSLRVINLKNRKITTIKTKYTNPNFYISNWDLPDENSFRYSVKSYTQPSKIFDYDLKAGKQKLVEEVKGISGFLDKDYKTETLFIKSGDGQDIPVTIVYNKKVIKEKPGSEKYKSKAYPMFMTAYGCYGISQTPYFSPILLSVLDRGVIYAVAHVRGGREKGPEWFRKGNAKNKLNTYTDFIDCTKGLIELGYAHSGKIGLYAASAGGVLGSYAINNYPDLFKVVIIDVPVCDLLSTLLKAKPMDKAHYDIYGNPYDSLEYYRVKEYSPIENVNKNNYPTVLIKTGYNDSRVGYWEGAKMAAYLRKNNLGENNIFHQIFLNAGHNGVVGYWEEINEVAFDNAFILYELKK